MYQQIENVYVAHCSSNNDELSRYEWPDVFTHPISKDDYVLSNCGNRVAKVASIMHATKIIDGIRRPYIKVEIKPVYSPSA